MRKSVVACVAVVAMSSPMVAMAICDQPSYDMIKHETLFSAFNKYRDQVNGLCTVAAASDKCVADGPVADHPEQAKGVLRQADCRCHADHRADRGQCQAGDDHQAA